jgi:hypothetical protein
MFMEGEIAEGGGDFTVVSFMLVLLESTVLLLVESVTITSDCANAVDMTKSTKNGNFLYILIPCIDFVFRMGYTIIYDKNVLYNILNNIKRKKHGTKLYDI